MKIDKLLSANAVIAGVFGLGFLLAPVQLLAPYSVELTPPGLIVARLMGASFIGYACVSWLLRNTQDAAVLRALSISLAIADSLGAVVATWGVVAGSVNALGWSTVAIYALLALGFGMHAAKGPAASPSPSR